MKNRTFRRNTSPRIANTQPKFCNFRTELKEKNCMLTSTTVVILVDTFSSFSPFITKPSFMRKARRQSAGQENKKKISATQRHIESHRCSFPLDRWSSDACPLATLSICGKTPRQSLWIGKGSKDEVTVLKKPLR